MRLFKVLTLVLVFFLGRGYLYASDVLSSPDGKLQVDVACSMLMNGGEAYFSVDYNGQSVFSKVKLGMSTESQDFSGGLEMVSASKPRLHKDDYMMLTGKRSHCVNSANESTYRFKNSKGQALDVTFRVYNDGIAFRYNLKASGASENITNEFTDYPVANGKKRWMQKFNGGYEGFYPMATNGIGSKKQAGTRWNYPALIEPQDSVFVLVTEANIERNHCGSFLDNTTDPNTYQVKLVDKKLPFSGEWTSPWRVLIIGPLDKIVESTLVTDVSDPSVISNTDWVKPGLASWVYWANNHGSKDFEIVKKYIDLAANMKWPYALIDWQWDVMTNGGNIEDAVKYALSKGIKPLLWYNSSTAWMPAGGGPFFRLNKKEKRLKEYAWLHKIGVAGIKVDFFSDDNASTMNYYLDLLEDAIPYKLLLNFHGCTIPRGWQRTYPNLMSMEAVYGAEWYNNNGVLTNRAAEHNATLPFTRNVIGSMDYTPGTFSNSQHPHITTYGQELALPLLFESGIQHMPDRPSVYDSFAKPVKDFLSNLPTAWDDTKLLAGYPGVDVVIARRKGKVWYVAGINGTNDSKTLSFSLSGLSSLGKRMTIIKDGANDKSFDIPKDVRLSRKNRKMSVACLPRGGFVAVIK